MSAGIAAGILKGAAHAVTEFIPETLSKLRGIGIGVWAFSKDPVGASLAFINAADRCIHYLQRNSVFQIAQGVVPELKELVQKYDVLGDYEKGELIGLVIGKYGTDILMWGYATKGIKACLDLKKANKAMTLEVLAAEKTEEKTIRKISEKIAERREVVLKNEIKIHEGKQGKHIENHPNYKDLVKSGGTPSILLHPKPEELLKKYGGTGRIAKGTPGKPGYVEIVDFQQIIGYAVDPNTGEKIATTLGKIHFSNNDAHIVPYVKKKI